MSLDNAAAGSTFARLCKNVDVSATFVLNTWKDLFVSGRAESVLSPKNLCYTLLLGTPFSPHFVFRLLLHPYIFCVIKCCYGKYLHCFGKWKDYSMGLWPRWSTSLHCSWGLHAAGYLLYHTVQPCSFNAGNMLMIATMAGFFPLPKFAFQ